MPVTKPSTTTPIYYRDATELAALIRKKELSPVEVVRAHLDRIAAVNSKVNAITTLLMSAGAKIGHSAPRERRIAAE